MSVQEWGIIVGAMMSAFLALAPWMFMVHAKLAVIATQIAELSDKIEKATESNAQLWDRYARHDRLLDRHEVQFAHVANKLEDI